MTLNKKTIFAAVLAAGSSKRFGSSKQLAHLRGKPMLQWATEAASGACKERVVLIASPKTFDSVAAVSGECCFFVINEDASDGLGSSIAAASKALSHRCDAMLIMLADQPLVTADHLHDLLARWSGDCNAIVVTEFSNTIGPPVLFPSGAFPALQRLKGDRGAHDVLKNSGFDITRVKFEPAGIDVDTPEDLDRLKRG